MNSDNVTYNGDLSTPFDPNLMDGFSIKSLITGELERCEHWGWNEEGENEHPYFDFGSVGNHAAFEVYVDHVRIFQPHPLYLGIDYNSPWKVSWIGDSECPPAGHGLFSDRLDVEKEYPRPTTMGDMKLQLIDYYDACLGRITAIEVAAEKNNTRRILKVVFGSVAESYGDDDHDPLPF